MSDVYLLSRGSALGCPFALLATWHTLLKLAEGFLMVLLAALAR